MLENAAESPASSARFVGQLFLESKSIYPRPHYKAYFFMLTLLILMRHTKFSAHILSC